MGNKMNDGRSEKQPVKEKKYPSIMSYGEKAIFIDTSNEQLRADNVELLKSQVAISKPVPIPRCAFKQHPHGETLSSSKVILLRIDSVRYFVCSPCKS